MPHTDPADPVPTPSAGQAKRGPNDGPAFQAAGFSWASAGRLLLGLIALTFLEFRAVTLIQWPHITAEVQAAQGVLSGYPHWRLYQSRLLGPLLVRGLARITHNPFAWAYDAVTSSLLLLANALCYQLFFLLGRSRRLAWGYTFAYAGLFVVLQDTKWLYLWDYVDLVTLLCFAYLVFTRTNLVLLSALFLVELLNREAATFIGLWIMMQAVRIPAGDSVKRLTFSPVPLLVGGGLIAGGVLWTHWIRNRLFIAQTQHAREIYVLGDQLWKAPSNLAALFHPFAAGTLVALIVVSVLVALLAQPGALPGEKKVKVAVLLAVMLVCVFLFALISETRVWFEFVPFGLFLFYHAGKQRSGPPRQG